MTKEELIAFGLNEAQAARVMEKFATDTKELVPKEKLEVAEQAKAALEKQVKEHDKSIEALKKSVGDTDKLNETISQLQEQGKKAAAEYAKNIKDMQVNFAVESALRQAKAKNVKAVKPFLNLEDIDIEDGKVKGLDKQIKKLVEGDDTKFLFDTPPKPNGGKPDGGIHGGTDKPNGGSGGGGRGCSVYSSSARGGNGGRGVVSCSACMVTPNADIAVVVGKGGGGGGLEVAGAGGAGNPAGATASFPYNNQQSGGAGGSKNGTAGGGGGGGTSLLAKAPHGGAGSSAGYGLSIYVDFLLSTTYGAGGAGGTAGEGHTSYVGANGHDGCVYVRW